MQAALKDLSHRSGAVFGDYVRWRDDHVPRKRLRRVKEEEPLPYTPSSVASLNSSCGFLGFNPTLATSTEVIDRAIEIKQDLNACMRAVDQGRLEGGGREQARADCASANSGKCQVRTFMGKEVCAMPDVKLEAAMALLKN